MFGRHLGLDWSKLLPADSAKIAEDGYGLFGFFVMMLLFKERHETRLKALKKRQN
jgi:SSS family solute:Na+ symporter